MTAKRAPLEKMSMMKILQASAVTLILAASVAQHDLDASPQSYAIDPASSRVTIGVGKAGALSFVAGHAHEVSGPIEQGRVDVDLDDPSRSHIHLTIAAAALQVSGADEPPDDRPKVQQTLESDKVLNVARYPQITFDSTEIRLKRRDARALELTVAGFLTIRGVRQPVSSDVKVERGENKLTATGRFEIKQTAFGIKPVSVAGVVSVKDAVAIAFSIAAARSDGR
jgi:polyisoprenoid-binding protein YceI